jgi:hypothetical protein
LDEGRGWDERARAHTHTHTHTHTYIHTHLSSPPQHFMESMERTLLELRKQFPKAYIMWRTAGQTRTTLEDGSPGAWHKEW